MQLTRPRADVDPRGDAVGPAVEVTDLRRRYGDVEAVRGISFEVSPGEVFALLGVNGAGKTSALEVLEGLAPASGGSVRILGADPRRERAAVRPHLGVPAGRGSAAVVRARPHALAGPGPAQVPSLTTCAATYTGPP